MFSFLKLYCELALTAEKLVNKIDKWGSCVNDFEGVGYEVRSELTELVRFGRQLRKLKADRNQTKKGKKKMSLKWREWLLKKLKATDYEVYYSKIQELTATQTTKDSLQNQLASKTSYAQQLQHKLDETEKSLATYKGLESRWRAEADNLRSNMRSLQTEKHMKTVQELNDAERLRLALKDDEIRALKSELEELKGVKSR